MKIHLIDPGLRNSGGHHHDWDTRIANYLAAAGHDVSVYCNISAVPGALTGFSEGIRVEKLFRFSPYIKAEELDPICGEIERQLTGAWKTREDLDRLDHADLWLLPTAFAYQLRAISMTRSKTRVAAALHKPPGNSLQSNGTESAEWWRVAAKALRHDGREIRIGVLEADALYAFRPFIGMLDPVLLPVPFDGTARRRTTLGTVGFFGTDMRPEQGARLLPSLLNACLDAGLQVATQTDHHLPVKLKQREGLFLLGAVGDFAAKVEACDLLVAPYDWSRYVGRGSGGVSQAMASGIPCVMPDGATQARTLMSMGSGVMFDKLTVGSIMNAIDKARRTYASLAEAAYTGAQVWRNENGVAAFVRSMIGETVLSSCSSQA